MKFRIILITLSLLAFLSPSTAGYLYYSSPKKTAFREVDRQAAQEKERSAVARELHDEFGQMLTALRMDSVWLQEYLKKIDPQAAQRALTMCIIIDKSIKEIRVLAMRLRPGVLDHLGLVDALEAHTSDFERRTGIHCTCNYRNVPHFDDLLATAAYRIAQDALTNIARHACADQTNVALHAEDSLFTLAVVDSGNGLMSNESRDLTV